MHFPNLGPGPGTRNLHRQLGCIASASSVGTRVPYKHPPSPFHGRRRLPTQMLTQRGENSERVPRCGVRSPSAPSSLCFNTGADSETHGNTKDLSSRATKESKAGEGRTELQQPRQGGTSLVTQSRAQKETLVPGDKRLLLKPQETVHSVGKGQPFLQMLLE